MNTHSTPLDLRLPVPGPAFGPYPERKPRAPGALKSWLMAHRVFAGNAPQRGFVSRVRLAQTQVPALGSDDFKTRLAHLRAELGLVGLNGTVLEQALAFVLSASQTALGVELYDTQLQAARILLDNRLAEMATGEGKTYAAMLAAASAALAGVPVHVVTANPYLAARDAAALAPLYHALGLRVAAVTPTDSEDQRRAAWAADVTYTTPRDLIFDYLRDRQRAQAGSADAPPLLRGLCMALVDEADSVLIDEARTPFILAEAVADKAAQRRWRAAIAAARRLQEHRHFELLHAHPRAKLTALGTGACPAEAGPMRDPLWRHDHHRAELVETALAALHLYRRDEHYIVQDQKVEIVDPTTGRVTPGRRWAAGLHQFIEIKEGLVPSPVQRTTAQLSFQRFFPRYWRLCGTSGTLSEASTELSQAYGLPVQKVPLRVPSQRQTSCEYLFASDEVRWPNVVRAIVMHHSAGRPVLVGCDSLADADHLCRLLDTQNLKFQRLDARQDAHEAACIAQAGERGAITVATRLAGRGTDIRLGDGVAALGGLVVIDAQANGTPRVDRQLHGRCARGGEPGQVMRLQALDSAFFVQELPAWLRSLLQRRAAARYNKDLHPLLARALRVLLQAQAQRRERQQRRALLQHDQDATRQLGFGGRSE
ncbi:MAG: hypothetical protein LW854_17585 [Rubrivivax sp.]|jgi:preprotein translocase subunit SecA|nr:hypothetical protein [Rubrivivax sp.]